MTQLFQPPVESNIRGEPYITVSSKGIANGLSYISNDGDDFGPDTPGTQTMGLQEAFNYGNQNNRSVKVLGNSQAVYLIDVPLTIGTESGQFWDATFEGLVQILPSSNFQSGQSMINVGASSQPSPHIVWSGHRLQVNGYNPSGTTVATSAFNFLGLGPGENQYVFDFDKCQFNAFTNALIINSGVCDRPVYMRGMVHQGSTQYDFYNTSLAAFYFDNCALTGSIYSNAPSGGGAGISFNGGIRPASITLESTGGENALIMINNGIANTNTLLTVSGYSQSNPANIFFIGNNTFLLSGNTTSVPYFNIGSYVNIFADTIRFAYNGSSGLTVPIWSFQSGTTDTNIYIKNVRFRNYVSGSTLEWTSTTNYLSPYIVTLPNFIIEQNTGIINIPQSQLTTNGTTAGTVTAYVIENTIYYKKVVFIFNGYENDTTTYQSIPYPYPSSPFFVGLQNDGQYPGIVFNSTGLNISANQSSLTVNAPNNTTTYSGIVIVEGY